MAEDHRGPKLRVTGFSSERELRLRAPPCGGRGGGRGRWVDTKNCAPRSILFSPHLARARVSLSCESACCAHAGAVCVQKFLSRVRRRSVSYPGVTSVEEQAGIFNVWALGQSAQAEHHTLILYSSQSPSYCIGKHLSTGLRRQDAYNGIPL